MIATVTLNPSLDYIVEIDNFSLGNINRTKDEKYLPGGKGLNVSQVLTNLGINNLALGIVGGFTGGQLVELLKERNVNQDLLHEPQALTRVNIKVRSQEETAINGIGPKISKETKEKLLHQIEELNSKDFLVLAGKIPPALPKDFYRQIMDKLRGRGVEIVVDAEGEQLERTIQNRPFLIKPNNEELGSLFNVEITKESDAIYYGKKLQERGARNIVISLGAKGGILITEDKKIFQGNSPKGKLVNSVGAGDSMVAGFLYGYLKKDSLKEALRYGIACGSASAFSEELATKDEVLNLVREIDINTLGE